MKTFDLELRVRTFGSIITWKILLEDSTNENNLVTDWIPKEDYRFKKLPGYTINDDSLEVFAGCQGILGGQISCEVLINEATMTQPIVARVHDREFRKGSFKIL